MMSNFDVLRDALDAHLAVPGAGFAAAGKSIINTAEVCTNGVYDFLGTDDVVNGITMPTDGLLAIWYKAQWRYDGNGGGRAAVFLNNTQLQMAHGAANSPNVQSAFTGGTSGKYAVLSTFEGGLAALTARDDVASGDVSTGQIVGGASDFTWDLLAEVGTEAGTIAENTRVYFGGPVWVFAAAGTYNVGVKFKRTGAVGASITVRNRKLWVASLAF
jgi:hypothetical protein